MEPTFENVLKLVFYKYWHGSITASIPNLQVMLGLSVHNPSKGDPNFFQTYRDLRYSGRLELEDQQLGEITMYLIGYAPRQGCGILPPHAIRGRYLKKLALRGFYLGVRERGFSFLSIYRPHQFDRKCRRVMVSSSASILASKLQPTAHEQFSLESNLKQLKKIAGAITWN